jgi:hypothetical protein
MYVEGNPINFTDPGGNYRFPCVIDLSEKTGWSDQAIDTRVNEAEKYVSHTSDPIDTYTAAGIAIQCAGVDTFYDPNNGQGIAQVSTKQAETEWGKPVYEYNNQGSIVPQYDTKGNIIYDKNGNPKPIIRGYGLRCPGDDPEKALDPYNNQDAVILMKRRIKLVTDACSNCTDTDIYIAAALAQNGPGFSQIEINQMGIVQEASRTSQIYKKINKDWINYFDSSVKKGNSINTRTQLNRFVLVVNNLIMRGWKIPFVDSAVIEKLRYWEKR